VILLAVAGSISSMLLQRYVIIVATSFGGRGRCWSDCSR
jgi:hypothetical protein